jgi:hypothetical protein
MHGGFGPGARLGIMPFGGDAVVTGAPYSAVQTTEMSQKLADGNTIVSRQQSNVYRDSQGRVRVEHTFSGRGQSAGQSARKVVSIFDPVAGATYMLQADTMTAYKSPVRPRTSNDAAGRGHSAFAGRHLGSAAAPAQTDNLGIQTINGVAATGTRTTQTIPAGAIGNAQPIQIVREVWTSQDLKIPVMIKTSDPRFGETVMQLTNLTQANPDPALFQVPAGYSVQAAPGHMRPGGAGATAPAK